MVTCARSLVLLSTQEAVYGSSLRFRVTNRHWHIPTHLQIHHGLVVFLANKVAVSPRRNLPSEENLAFHYGKEET
jgi:hypothetical protein